MEVDLPDPNNLEEESRLRKNRIKMFKSILNYYKGRSLSLNFVLACKQPSINVPPEMKTYESLVKDIQCLQNDIILIQSIRNCVKLVHSSLASTELMSANSCNFKLECLNKIEGIIYMSKSIMKLYNECCSELDLIEKMKSYSTVLTDYMLSLERLKEQEKSRNDTDVKEMEKAELQIYKINLMRTMKAVLIGYISLHCPNLLRNVQNLRSPMRRDLTMDDFYDSWDVGLPSEMPVSDIEQKKL